MRVGGYSDAKITSMTVSRQPDQRLVYLLRAFSLAAGFGVIRSITVRVVVAVVVARVVVVVVIEAGVTVDGVFRVLDVFRPIRLVVVTGVVVVVLVVVVVVVGVVVVVVVKLVVGWVVVVVVVVVRCSGSGTGPNVVVDEVVRFGDINSPVDDRKQ